METEEEILFRQEIIIQDSHFNIAWDWLNAPSNFGILGVDNFDELNTTISCMDFHIGDEVAVSINLGRASLSP